MRETINIDPPKLALHFFRWYCRSDRLEELEGDLEEMHALRAMRITSKIRLKLLFWWDVLRCFKKYSVNKTQLPMNTALYKSYTKIAMRSAWKHKGPVFTNVIGMGLALGYCITVYMIHAYNLEFDSYYENTDDIVRVHSFRMDNNRERRNELTPLPMMASLKNDVAAVEDVTAYQRRSSTTVKHKSEYYNEFLAFASSNFIDFFEIPLGAGSGSSFADPNTIFLSIETAEKYYGETSPIGEMLTIYIDDTPIEVQVGGVFKKMPLNNSFNFNIMLNMEAYLTAMGKSESDWENTIDVALYAKTTDPSSIQRVLTKAIPLQNEMQDSRKIHKFETISFVDRRVADHIIDSGPANNRMRPQALIIFTVMGVLILLVACFNMANSSMALIAFRVKEVGIRKTLGSKNRQIFFQFLFEMFVMMSLSFVLALALSNVIATQILGLFGVTFLIQDISILNLIPFLMLFAFGCTILAGLLPALYSWRFQPISILSGNYSLKGVGLIQKLFTVGQYTFSIAVLIAGWTFAMNTDYVREMDVGFNYEGLLMVPINNSADYEKFKNQIEQLADVSQVIGTNDHHQQSRSRGVVTLDTGKVQVSEYNIGRKYISMMEIDVLQGRDFLENSESDYAEGIIVNEAFTSRFFPDKDPINKRVKFNDQWRSIVGVTKDVIYNMYEDYVPRPEVYILTAEANYNHVLVKVASTQTLEAEKKIKAIWADNFDAPYRGTWQEDLTNSTARRDSSNLKSIFLSLATLGCFLCLLGIISLATMNVKKKTKEICIRKVLGASYRQILMKVNRSFIVILIISLILGVGLGVFLSDAVMNMIYQFHIEASILYSTAIGLAVVLISILFISLAVSKPVNANPSEGLTNNI